VVKQSCERRRPRREGEAAGYLDIAAPVEVEGDTLVVGAAERLFVTRPAGPEIGFDATADGQRFLVGELLAEQADPRPLAVLVNWPATLDRR
jgi:hypothetical protein